MDPSVQLCLVLHNHQPIGNFDDVIERAYEDSYLPFLNVLEDYPGIHLSLHTSGPLMLRLAERHPDYLQRVETLVRAGRIEIIGGPMYEPILTMLPSRDRIGQIWAYSNFLSDRFRTEVRGLWVPERVWESNLTSDLARAGMRYTVLDDHHFVSAGLPVDRLSGYYLTEDNGCVLRVFPGSERLRYLIPFADVDDTIHYLRQAALTDPGCVLVFGDDGEKFGTWPDTKAHVYQHGWLRRFFDALMANRHWLKTSTLAEAVATTEPKGKIYLPDCSYREMTNWALPVQQQLALDGLQQSMHAHDCWPQIQSFLRGGNWRNFKARYAEANEMYARMMQISQSLEVASRNCGDSELLYEVEEHLYKGQCNCAYWHGAFGGIYLPHLRAAVFGHLIAADNRLSYLEHGHAEWIDATSDDFNFDGMTEVRLANDQMVAFVAPSAGGMLYEWDVRSAAHNLLATMQRRREAYHDRILSSTSAEHNNEQAVESIHDRVLFKQAGLDQRLQYDLYPRKSFLEHFYDNDADLAAVAAGRALERGDFVASPFDAKLRRATNKVQLQLSREGNAWGIPFRITKALTMQAGQSSLEIAYLIEGLPQDRPLHLALEWNFAGMPSNADDRYFYDGNGQQLGHLGTQLDLKSTRSLGLIDCWMGLDVTIHWDRTTDVWTFPIESVSQSEAGFELVHQSISLQPHWLIQGDREGRWSMQMKIDVVRRHQPALAASQIMSTQLTGLPLGYSHGNTAPSSIPQ